MKLIISGGNWLLARKSAYTGGQLRGSWHYKIDNKKSPQWRLSRQSFLGKDSQAKIEACTVGIVGIGGGGSHIVQQFAHIGFQNFVMFDPDLPEDSNLNRLISATVKHVKQRTPKVQIAKRRIIVIQPNARVLMLRELWQDNPVPLGKCDIIIGCVDGYKGRHELETFSRRHLIPYINIGIDVCPN